MKNKSIFYELEFINGIIRKVNYKGKQGSLYNFKYDDLNAVKKSIDITNGIYFVSPDQETMDLYIGQTTNGLDRFSSHRMKEYQDTAKIYFFQFDGESPSKNLLDYLETKLIGYAKESKYNALNSTLGNKENIREIDKQFASEIEPTIITLLKVFDLDFAPLSDTTKEIKFDYAKTKKIVEKNDKDDDFFLKSNGADFKISRVNGIWILREGSKVNGKKRWIEDHESVSSFSFYKNFVEFVDDKGMVTTDIAWKSISPLVAFARGQIAAPGWTEIKNADGKTPHEVYRE